MRRLWKWLTRTFLGAADPHVEQGGLVRCQSREDSPCLPEASDHSRLRIVPFAI
jgi:hypothetical protein